MQDGVGGIFQCAATIEGLLHGNPREHPASFHTMQSIVSHRKGENEFVAFSVVNFR